MRPVSLAEVECVQAFSQSKAYARGRLLANLGGYEQEDLSVTEGQTMVAPFEVKGQLEPRDGDRKPRPRGTRCVGAAPRGAVGREIN